MLNPWLLWFLPLAAVPLLLHLLTLYRLRTVELSTYRFLMDSYVQQRRRTRLLEWLIMLLRIAFIVLLIVALSRPVIEPFAWLTQRTGRDVAIILDVSPSMMMRSGGTTSLERLQSAGRSLGELLHEDDRVTIIRAGAEPRVIFTREGGGAQMVTEQLQSITADSAAGPMAEAIDLAIQSTRAGRRLIYILTDSNQRAWSSLQGHPVVSKLDREQIVVLDVGSPVPTANLAVIGDTPGMQRPVIGLPVSLQARVLNTSDTVADTTLTVTLDEQQVTQMSLSLQPGEQQTRSFSVTPTRAGPVRGRFQLSGDTYSDDNIYHFCLNVQPQVEVLIISDRTAGDAPFAAGLFVEAALRAPGGARRPASVDEVAEYPNANDLPRGSAIVTSIRTPTEVSELLLEQVDTVVLADVRMTPGLANLLKDYLRDGGGVMILPGPRTNIEDYDALLFEPDPRRSYPGMPLRWSAAEGDQDREQFFQSIGEVDHRHIVMRPFTDDGANYFGTVRVYRYFPIVLPSTEDEDRVRRPRTLMQLRNQQPILVHAAVGAGEVIVSGLPMDPAWSNLPLKPEFVPLMIRSATHIRRGTRLHVLPEVRPGEHAPIRIGVQPGQTDVEVIAPDGRPTAINLHHTARSYVGAMTQTTQRGHYSVRVTHTSPTGVSETTEAGFTVNLDVNLDDFRRLDQTQLASLLGSRHLTHVKATASDPMLVSQLTNRREIWRVLIFATVAVIVAEFLLSTLSTGRNSAAGKSDAVEGGAPDVAGGIGSGPMRNLTGFEATASTPRRPMSERFAKR